MLKALVWGYEGQKHIVHKFSSEGKSLVNSRGTHTVNFEVKERRPCTLGSGAGY